MSDPNRRRAAADLEARIAQLDERLRLAKQSEEGSAPSPATSQGNPQAQSINRSEAVNRSTGMANATPIRRTESSSGGLSGYLGGALSNATYSSPLYTDPHRLGKGVMPTPARGQQADATPALPQDIPLAAAQTPYHNKAVDESIAAPIHSSGYEAYSSPWRESTFRANVEASAYLQQVAAETRGKRLNAMVTEAHAVGSEVEERDAQLLWYTARKDSAAAEMHTYLREANDKVEALERADIKVTTDTAATKLEIEKVRAQLKEVREGMSRASERAHGIHAERVQLLAALKGSSQGASTRDALDLQWHRHHKEDVMSRLNATIASLAEDVKAAEERFAAREQSLQASRIAATNEAKALAAEANSGKGILADLQTRGDSLSRELSAFKVASAAANVARTEKAADAERKRSVLLSGELARAVEENASLLRTMTVQADTITAQLTDEVADLERKLAKTKAASAEAGTQNSSLVEKLASLQSTVQSTQDNDEPLCRQREADVQDYLAARESNRAEIDKLQRIILQAQDDVRQLELSTSRLQELLDEESSLKMLLASVSAEMATSTDMRNEESKHHTGVATAIEAAHKESLEKVAEAEAECQRVKGSNAATLDSLTRRLHEARESLALKEQKLDELLTKNTNLQNTIIQFEEEKRKMERDAMVRKEAASRAAKAALLDLQ